MAPSMTLIDSRRLVEAALAATVQPAGQWPWACLLTPPPLTVEDAANEVAEQRRDIADSRRRLQVGLPWETRDLVERQISRSEALLSRAEVALAALTGGAR